MRIRYRKTRQTGLLESVQRYQHPNSGARYKVLLNTLEHRWLVVDEQSELVAASGLRVHPHKARIDAREALEKLGIVLSVDERVKRAKKIIV